MQTFADLFKTLPNGEYIVELDFLNGKQLRTITVADGVVTTSGAALNENYIYTGKINNTTLTFDSVVYDCFQFETKLYV